MTHDEALRELHKRYGTNALYSKMATDHPLGVILFHRKTGFSVGFLRKNGEGFITDSGKLQQSYRIDT